MNKKNIIAGLAWFVAVPVLSATPIELQNQSTQILNPYIQQKPALITASKTTDQTTIKVVRAETDKIQTTHTRMQEIFSGLPVWGGDFIIHTPQAINTSLKTRLNNKNSTMNGILYQNLEKDLVDKSILNDTQKNKAINLAKKIYNTNNLGGTLQDENVAEIIFVSNDNKAHFAYKISFFDANRLHRPVYIIDAATFTVYKSWDDIRTYETHKVISIGGNESIGKLVYDNTPEHFPAIDMYVDNNECYFENDNFKVTRSERPFKKPCMLDNPSTSLFKITDFDTLDSSNGGYSPATDTLFGASVTEAFYQQWYGVFVVPDNNYPSQAAKIPLQVHGVINFNTANAAYDPRIQAITFGDGNFETYPFVLQDIVGHELSHGFTAAHSNLTYFDESGAINESFSDMAAKAIEYYQTGKNQWTIGLGLYKNGKPLRYMDEPKKDGISIDNINQYNQTLDIHYTSGIYNKVFYLLATKNGWNTKTAFDLMVYANRYYWLPDSSFHSAACGVLSAAKQSNYSINDVKESFSQVGIDTSDCSDATPSQPKPVNNPECYTNQSLYQWDQLPCHTFNHNTNVGNVVSLPVTDEYPKQILLVNNSNNNTSATIEIAYADHCSMDNIEQWERGLNQPTKTKKRIVLANKESTTVSFSSNCAYQKIYRAPWIDFIFGREAATKWGSVSIKVLNSVDGEEINISHVS